MFVHQARRLNEHIQSQRNRAGCGRNELTRRLLQSDDLTIGKLAAIVNQAH